MLAAACIAAALVFTAALTLGQAFRERDLIKDQALGIARATANAAEQEFASAFGRLEALGAAPAFRRRDIQAVYEQMMATPTPPDSWLILWDAERQLANTLMPYGASGLPRFSDFAPGVEAGRQQVFVRGERRIANLRKALVAGSDRMVMSVFQPVRIDGVIAFALSAVLSSDRLEAVVSPQRLPSGWFATLLDRQGTIMVRTGELLPGSRPPEDLLQSIAGFAGVGGSLDGVGLFGTPEFLAVAPVGQSGLVVVLQVPAATIAAPVLHAFKSIGLFGVLMLVVMMIAAMLLARRVEKPIAALQRLVAFTTRQKHRIEARQDALWANSNEALFDLRISEDGCVRLEAVNPSYARLLGLQTEKIIGRDITEFLPADAAAVAMAHARKCATLGTTVRYANSFKQPDGASRDWEIILVPVIDTPAGPPTLLMGSVKDRTEEQRAKRERDDALDMFRRITETSPDVLYIYDLQTRTNIWINRQVGEVLGYSALEIAEMGDRILSVLLDAYDDAKVDAHLRACSQMTDGEVISVEYKVRDSAGRSRWLLSRETVFARADDGQVTRILGCAQDITMRRLAEAEANATGDLLKRTLDALSAHIVILDDQGDIVAANAAWQRFAKENGHVVADGGLGMSYFSVCGVALRRCPDTAGLLDGLRAVMDGRLEDFRAEYGFSGPGERCWFQLRVTRFSEDGPRRFVVAHEDITIVKAAEERLRNLASHVLTAQDEERRRIARELHDSTAQNLFGATLTLNCVRNLTPDMAEGSAALLAESLALIDESQREIRTLAYLLHPPMLDEIGLCAALEWFAQGLARRSGLNITVEAGEVPERLSKEIAMAFFRVAQEALTNVHRHAAASSVTVRIAVGGDGVADQLRMSVCDNGHGLKGSANFSKPRGNDGTFGVGITSMRERMRQFRGWVHVRPAFGGGTLLEAVAPLPESVDSQPAV